MQKISLHIEMFSASLETNKPAGQFSVDVTNGYRRQKGIRGKNRIQRK